MLSGTEDLGAINYPRFAQNNITPQAIAVARDPCRYGRRTGMFLFCLPRAAYERLTGP
ncbi:hypothetical protein [Nocardia sp. SYP-A9097]|uniref:hypothetical protein n=1 Tax=Nocardia sp. SYP-A9097 TaxID=2663237 RepID=UPI00129B0622|nr:hypothetical protein [Nocardia sp. SYP-A9097]